jgi:hypothetical protein
MENIKFSPSSGYCWFATALPVGSCPCIKGQLADVITHKASQAFLAFPNLFKAEWMIENFPAGWSDVRQQVATSTLGWCYSRQFLVNTVTSHSF